MELRGQDKEEIGMPYSPPINRRESPSKPSPPSSLVSALGDRERRRDAAPSQTLDHHHHHNHFHHHHQFNHHRRQDQQQTQLGQQVGDPEPDPDPDPVSASIAVSGATTTTTPPISGSNPKAAAAPPQSPASIRYRECLKNHAASMGGHVLDGCGEFMPSGEEGSLEALKCAACDCHRNFHRKEIDGETAPPPSAANCYYTLNPNSISARRNPVAVPPPQLPPSLPHLHQHHKYSHGLSGSPLMSPIPQMMMAFGGGGAPAESSSEDLNVFQSSVGMHLQPQPAFALSKKRYRTKFSQEQKDKMQEFAEKLGWKIQKQEEQEVQQFCSDVGVKRQVFKVWMHNNKQAMKKKQL